jgi:hypothetical protein
MPPRAVTQVVQLKAEADVSTELITLKFHLRNEYPPGQFQEMSSQPVLLTTDLARDLAAQLVRELDLLALAKVPNPSPQSPKH